MEKAHRDIYLEHTQTIEVQASNIRNLNTIKERIIQIKSKMNSIISSMGNVTESIEDFNKMTNEIQKIAMQINMISLNASIESARVGENGKAFGVVAEEIRNLANGSSTSVKNSESVSSKATNAINLISEMISQISDSVNESYNEVVLITEKTQKIVSNTSK